MSAHPKHYDGTEGDHVMESEYHDEYEPEYEEYEPEYERHVQQIAAQQVYYRRLWSLAYAAVEASIIQPEDIEDYVYEMACASDIVATDLRGGGAPSAEPRTP